MKEFHIRAENKNVHHFQFTTRDITLSFSAATLVVRHLAH